MMGKVKFFGQTWKRCEITQFLINKHKRDTHGRPPTSVYSFARCEVVMAAVPSETPVKFTTLCGDTSLRTFSFEQSCVLACYFDTVNKIT
jgi:hypothetical protein